MQQRNVNKDCRVLFGDILILPFLGPALGYLTAMCSPGWGNVVVFDWNDLAVGREFSCKFLKNVKSPPHALPSPTSPPPPPRRRRLYIDRCLTFGAIVKMLLQVTTEASNERMTKYHYVRDTQSHFGLKGIINSKVRSLVRTKTEAMRHQP